MSVQPADHIPGDCRIAYQLNEPAPGLVAAALSAGVVTKKEPMMMKPLAACLILASCSTAFCQDKVTPEVTTKIYRVDCLQRNSTPTSHAVPTGASIQTAAPATVPAEGFGGQGGGLGGGGLGGGGFGGGGGSFFSISEPMSPQFGQVTVQPTATAHTTQSSPIGDVVGLITTCVDPMSWQQSGGTAAITIFGDALVVRQTADNHAQISELLKNLRTEAIGEQVVAVSLWLIKADNDIRKALPELITTNTEAEELTQLAESTSGYHVEIKTLDRMNATVSDGDHTTVISSQIPSTGTNSSGYQPVITPLFDGFSAAVHPRILPVSEGEGIQLTVTARVTSIRNLVRHETTGRETDTYELLSRDVNGTVLCHPKKPIIIGSLSVRAEEESELTDQWTLIASVSLPTQE